MLRYSSRLIASLALGLTGGVVLLADGAQTGTLVGVVKDDKGMPISGAAVRITGSTLMGERLLTTSAAGSFRAPSLPPGTAYEVTVVAEGYQTAKVPARVGVNQVFQMTVALQPIAASVVEVVAVGSSIDTTTVSSPTNTNREMIDNLPLPLGRDYQGIMALTPGIVGRENPSALGGNNQENLYLLDGVDTTDATLGTFSMNLNLEAIEEVQVLTTGVGAEYGRFGGAIANVVTRSGGNKFEGGLRYDFYNLAWDAQGKFDKKPKSKITATPSLSLGGYLIKDKLWFFVTAQTNKSEDFYSAYDGDTYTREFKADPVAYSAKLTWQLTPNQSLVLQTTGDPTYIENEVAGYVPLNLGAVGDQSQGVSFASLTYRAIPRQDLTLDIKVARHTHKIDVTSNVGEKVATNFLNTSAYENNIPEEARIRRTRSQFNTALTWYTGLHELKFGIDFQSSTSGSRIWRPGGATLQKAYNEATDSFDIINSLYVQKTNVLSESKQNYTALYVNDVWKINPYIATNIGLRLEKYTGKNDAGTKIFDFTSVNPRIGLTYDWKGDGHQSLGIYYGRYTISPKQNLLDEMAVVRNEYIEYYDYKNNDKPYDIDSYDNAYPIPANTPPNASNNIKAGYSDEFVLSGKFLLGNSWSFMTQGVSRDFRQPIMIFRFYSEPAGPNLPMNLIREARNADGAKREYRAWINTLDYQGKNWNTRLTYTYSTLKGNYDGSDLYNWYGNFYEGAYIPKYNDARVRGRLDMDQPHALQLFIGHKFNLGNLNIFQGVTSTYKSGPVWAKNGVWENPDAPDQVKFERNNKHLITENGTWGDRHFPSQFRLHYSLNTEYRFASSLRLRFGLDIYNILNRFRAEKYNTEIDKIDIVNGKPVLTPSAIFGKSFPDDYTPGRKVRFTTSLRF